MKKKPFIITIDTEGDNIWNHNIGDIVSTNNSLFLTRFQKMCDKYGYKPTYLVNFEMISCDTFTNFAKETLKYNGCEIGMHLHAWNNPPIVELKKRDDKVKPGLPYITEYNEETICKKVSYLTNLIEEKLGVKPISHRAGRWASNDVYARILAQNGYKYDCTITPLKSWTDCAGYSNSSFGSNYSYSKNKISKFYNTSVIEVPFQWYKNHRLRMENVHGFLSLVKNVIYALKRKELCSLRPNGKNLNDLLYIVKKNRHSRQRYLMFMLHSSEFMPGGSPTFDDKQKIEKLYADLEILFSTIAKYYYGVTLKEFGNSIKKI